MRSRPWFGLKGKKSVKIEAILIGYAIAGAAATGAQAVAPQPADIFWPAIGGAVFASLRTLLKAFSANSSEPLFMIALKTAISLTGGFLAGFFCTEWLFSGIAAHLRPPMAVGALIVAAGGEFALSMLVERGQKIFANGGQR